MVFKWLRLTALDWGSMPFDHDAHSKLFDDLFFKRISEERFLEEIQSTRETINSLILAILETGLKEKNSDFVESAIPLMYRFGVTKEYLSVLNKLAEEPWHQKHEDVVFALGKLKDPSSVLVLSKTVLMNFPYLESDEAFALATKSIYAMKNIQTPEAVRMLGELAQNTNDVIKTTAIGRLKDIAMKGETDSAKLMAQSFLGG